VWQPWLDQTNDPNDNASVNQASGAATRPLEVLAAGAPASFAKRLHQWAARQQARITLRDAPTLEQARAALSDQPADVALVSPQCRDGSGLDLAEELAKQTHLTQTLLIAARPGSDLLLRAMRAGISDVIDPRFDTRQIDEHLQTVLHRPTPERVQAARAERLQRLCERLNSARQEVSGQVDTLCSDLVSAYQELAGQIDEAMIGTEYTAMLDQELDLELLLRRTLEFLIRKVGRTNGVVYLPCSADEFSLGGFVARNSEDGPPRVLLEDLADRLAPAISEQDEVIHITDDDTMQQWVGDTLGPLQGQHLIAFPCKQEDETLAVVALFRDEGDPFARQASEIAAAVAPRLGEALERMIRIHHRHMPDAEMEDDA